MPTRKWGGEKLVNTTTLNDQGFSDVAVLADGSYIVVWEDTDSLAEASIRGQRFDSAGNKIGGEIAISAPTGNADDQTQPEVTALANGGFYVSWNDEDSSTDHDVVGAVFDANGTFVRSQDGDSASVDDVDDIEVSSLGTGSIAVWTNGPPGAEDVHFRIFDAAGSAGTILTANTSTIGGQGLPSVAVRSNQDRIAIVWRDANDNTLKGRLFDAAGNEFAPEFVINPPTFFPTDPEVIWLNNEHFAVLWREGNDFNEGGNEIRARIFDGQTATPTPLTGVIPVNSTIADSQQAPSITALPNGGFVVVWADGSGVGPDSSFAVRLQAFDGSGGKIGGEIVVNTTTTNGQFDPSVAALPDGRVVVTWTDDSSGTNDIRMQIVDPRDGIVTGTPESDTLFGHDLVNDEITGFGGNDLLIGMKGDDGLYGGEGNDRLRGGLGGDNHDGGVGTDSADYTGSKAVVVNLATDAASGGFAVGDSFTSIEGVIGSAFADTLTGDSRANKLFGMNGSDRLIGGSGNDILTGGLNKDVMTGGADLDDFDFNSVADIGKGATRDVIMDFVHLSDDIDLSTIDANGGAAGNTAFTFRATEGASFTGVRGQLRWFQQNPAGTNNDRTLIEGDINGDSVADFQIELSGLKMLTVADCFL